MRRTTTVLIALLVALATALGASLAMTTSASAGSKLPVPYNFLPAALQGGMPGSVAPGTNNWHCKPTKRHPRPVILVHGTAGNRSTNWQTYGPLLKNNGYCVFALSYGVVPGAPVPLSEIGGMNSMVTSAKQLRYFAYKVRKATGAKKVDLIGHSQGTLMPNYWVKFLGGKKYVYRYISLAPLWHGTQAAEIPVALTTALGVPDYEMPVCGACTQMASGSAFMKKMRRGRVAVKGVHYTNIMTTHDELVLPYTSGIEKGMRNVVLQRTCKNDFSDHLEIAASRNAAVFVLNALDPKHKRPLHCVLTLPAVGGLN